MSDHDKISLTGKKVPMVDPDKLDPVYRSKTWQERMADMARMRKMVMNDMLGLGWGKDDKNETPTKNN